VLIDHDRNGTMSDTRKTNDVSSQVRVYQIRLRGHLGRHWTAWFEGLTITLEANGDSLLTGPVVDQAALHGVLTKIRDLGLPLVSIIVVEREQADVADGQP
jgi:hypothetical protein